MCYENTMKNKLQNSYCKRQFILSNLLIKKYIADHNKSEYRLNKDKDNEK